MCIRNSDVKKVFLSEFQVFFIIFLTICKRLPNLNYRLSLASCWEEQVGVGAMVGQWAQQ